MACSLGRIQISLALLDADKPKGAKARSSEELKQTASSTPRGN